MNLQTVFFLGLVGLGLVPSNWCQAAYRQAELPLVQLPTEHAYQKELRDFLATLTENDLTVELRPLASVAIPDEEEQYRLWLLAQHLPSLRAVTLPAQAFTLAALESQKGLRLPTAVRNSQLLAWVAHWEYPGNLYQGSRALKLRAAVLATVDLVMLDYLYEHDPQGAARSDYLGGNLIWIGYTFHRVQDVLPRAARRAFEAGLKKHVLRLDQWGPTGIMLDMDLFAPVGLRYIYEATSDPELKAVAERYSRRLFTEEQYFHPAGYFTDCQ